LRQCGRSPEQRTTAQGSGGPVSGGGPASARKTQTPIGEQTSSGPQGLVSLHRG
jgi:hypothetical protein